MTAPASRSRWARQRWLLLRRASQLVILLLFLLGPVAGVWIIRGNLSSSVLLDRLPMSEPLLLLQMLMAGHLPELSLLIGSAVIAIFYALAGGRVFCAWVCPLNMVTDLAAWLRRRLGLKNSRALPLQTRRWVLAVILLLPLISGVLAWELINPVAALQRGLLFGMGASWLLVAGVFLLDSVYLGGGFCRYFCPQGQLYALLGRYGLLKVAVPARSRCDECMDCYAVCPEPQVLRPALKGEAETLVRDNDCTKCGRCIDVCDQQVFEFANRFAHRVER